MNPRALAISVLARVEATEAYLNVALDSALDEHRMKDPRDTALVTELCYGATRRRLALDAAILKFCDRKLAALEDRVLAALRLGAYQHFYTRVPARAAVGETVEALKSLGLGRATGFVNAILRKITSLEGAAAPAGERPDPPRVGRAQPPRVARAPLVRAVRARARARDARGGQRAPAAGDPREHPEAVARRAPRAAPRGRAPRRADPLLAQGIALGQAGRVEDLFGYPEGLWQVQDEAAQLVGEYAEVPEGVRVLDCCAAPGGKTCHLAERHEVVAIDLHANKLPKIASELKRLGLSEHATLLAHDATNRLPDALGDFDAILVDAPCSGLGTLRRHPELRYRRQPHDFARLASLQKAILDNVCKRVKPGGLLVYALCTTEPEESQDQVRRFLAEHPEFTLAPPKAEALAPLLEEGCLRTLPGPEGFDGFFAARLVRAR